jgi:hypothetical protein
MSPFPMQIRHGRFLNVAKNRTELQVQHFCRPLVGFIKAVEKALQHNQISSVYLGNYKPI